MMIHTSTLTRDEITAAARRAGVAVIRVDQKGSRRRARKFDVLLTGSGVMGGMYGNLDYSTATWDEWGVFLAAIFSADPEASTDAYDGADHFRWSTGARYDDLDITAQHKRHKWNYVGESMTGSYTMGDCKCGAIRRFMVRGTFADIA